MSKGYIISRVDIINPDAYAGYAAAATKTIADYGGKALARGGRSEALEGNARARNVVLEFESYDAARRYFHSDRYQAARALREGAAEIEMVLVEGVLRMPKGYWIVHIDVRDPEVYQQYVKANAAAFAKYGARFLVRGGKHLVTRGKAPARNVVIEFRDYETAISCHDSEEYREASKLRDAASNADLVIVEGYDGPQPG